MPENIDPSSLDAPRPEPTPATPPPNFIDASLLSDRAMEALQYELNQADRDAIEKARIAGREAQRAANAKIMAEREASSKRAADAVQEVIDRDKQQQEEDKPSPTGPPVELALPPLLTAEQTKMAEGYVQDMGEIAAELGMPAEEAQLLLDYVVGGATQTLDGLDTTNREEVISHMHNIYGQTAADAIITGARAGFAKLPEGVQQWLDRTTDDGQCLGNHPAVLSMLALWGGGYSKLTPAAAAKELAVHRASKAYLAGDRATLDKVRLLTMISTRGQSDEMEMPRPTVRAAKSAVEQEIDAIRKNPDYTSMDSKKRAPLVARMSALMAHLHQG